MRGPVAITERQFTAQVLQLALHLGWRRAHFRPARPPLGRAARHDRRDRGAVPRPAVLPAGGARRVANSSPRGYRPRSFAPVSERRSLKTLVFLRQKSASGL